MHGAAEPRLHSINQSITCSQRVEIIYQDKCQSVNQSCLM